MMMMMTKYFRYCNRRGAHFKAFSKCKPPLPQQELTSDDGDGQDFHYGGDDNHEDKDYAWNGVTDQEAKLNYK